MAHPAGESIQGRLRVNFDRRLKLECHGSKDGCERNAVTLAVKSRYDSHHFRGSLGDADSGHF